MIFQEQAQKWALHADFLVERAIIIVHQFVFQLMEDIFENAITRRELLDLMNDKMINGYKRAYDHKDFLVKMELGCRCQTHNPNLDAAIDKIGREHFRTTLVESYNNQKRRLGEDQAFTAAVEATFGSSGLCDDLHDLLQAYYSIALDRFVDNICRQAVSYFLLEADSSPVKLLNAEFVSQLSDSQLERIAGEDAITRLKRVKLEAERGPLEKALKVLRE